MLSKYKSNLNSLILIVAKPFMRIHPNFLTMIGLLFPLLFFYFMYQQNFTAALISLVGVLFDSIDGAVARNTGRTSLFGGVLDSSVDRVADAIYIIAFYYAELAPIQLLFALLVSSFLISYIRSRSELAGKGSFILNIGLIERSERMIFVLFATLGAIFNTELAKYVLSLLFTLSIITVLQRLMLAERKLRSIE